MFVALFSLIAFGVPIAFALLASCLIPIMIEDRLSLYLVVQRTYNSLDTFLLLAIPFFLLAGNLMNSTGVTERLVRFSASLVGHMRGGMAQINVMVNMMFAGVSGSSIADAAGTGAVLIPAMRKRGFPVEFAVALTASASVMGVIIPPSLLMVVWGAMTETSIGALFVAGIVPGILIGVGQMMWVYFVARRRRYPVEAWQGVGEILVSGRRAALALMLPVIIVGGIRAGWFTPTEASVSAVLYALFLGFLVYRSLSLGEFNAVMYDSARLVSLSLFCVGAAGLFGFMLAYYKIPLLMTNVTDLLHSPILLLVAIVILFLILGTFLDGLVITIICGPLFLPAVRELGIDPVHYGIVGCIAIAIGLVTPPYGLCLLVASSIGGIPMQRAFPDMLRLLAVMAAVLMLVILFPDLALAPTRWLAF
jgi:tripartite ATP-independent transporter DctM subunit